MSVRALAMAGTAGATAVAREWFQGDLYTPLALETSGSGTYRDVYTQADFDTAVSDMESGTLVAGSVVRLQDDGAAAGVFTGPGNVAGITGTAAAPYVVRPASGHTVTIREWNNGIGSVWHNTNCSYVQWHDITFDGTKSAGFGNWGLTFGRRFDTDATTGSCDNIVVRNCEFKNQTEANLRIDFDSNNVQVLGCEIHTDQGSSCEAIYLGDGNHSGGPDEDGSYDILIEDTEFRDFTGNGKIKITSAVYNITVRGCYFHDIAVGSQGVITSLIDWASTASAPIDHNILIEGNWIHDISRRVSPAGSDGDGICFARGTTTVRNNVVWNCAGNGIEAYENSFRNGYLNYYVYNNTVWNCGTVSGNDYHWASDGPYTSTDSNGVGTTDNNIAQDATGEYQAVAADFVGPVTGTADVGSGAGSGFVLDSGSSAIGSGTTVGSVTEDITGITRTAPYDDGAYQAI